MGCSKKRVQDVVDLCTELFVFGNQLETNQQLRVCVRLLSAPLKFLLRAAYH